jgi:hypothetical protein
MRSGPPIFHGALGDLAAGDSRRAILVGIVVSMAGVDPAARGGRYFQFFFYTMGERQMETFRSASCPP